MESRELNSEFNREPKREFNSEHDRELNRSSSRFIYTIHNKFKPILLGSVAGIIFFVKMW